MSTDNMTISAFKEMWKDEFLPSIHKSIQVEIEPIKQNMAALGKRCNEIEKSQEFVSKRFDDLITALQQSQKRIEALEITVNHQEAFLNNLTSRIDDHDGVSDDMQQYLRRDCLEFVGIPELSSDDDPKSLVKEMCAFLNVDVDDSDISIVHRLKDTKYAKHRIIAKFTRREKRMKYMARSDNSRGNQVTFYL
jgi:uncharacterized coiled-coil protein SlyX